MTFWIITGAIAFAVAAMLLWSARRAQSEAEPPAAYDMRVYRDQLKEVDRDVARGVLNEEDAERVRIEVSRRILAADAALQGASETKAKSGLGLGVLGAICALAVAASIGLYTRLGAPGYSDLQLADRIAAAEARYTDRPSQAQAEAAVPNGVAEDGPEYAQLVAQLRTALEERPDDLRGHQLLARSEARLGNFTAAHAAQERVIALSGGPSAPLQVFVDYADLLVLAAGGYVSPEAENVLNLIVARDPQNGVARYYWGLMQIQIGRPDRAFRVWDALLREGPADAPWIEPVLTQIEETAMLAGVRYQVPVIGTGRGPSQDDIDAAQEMSPAERMQMVEGMVSGLATRLAEDGGPPRDWAQLITALGVLGRMDQAFAVFQNAKEAFEGNPAAMDIINGAADQAGLL